MDAYSQTILMQGHMKKILLSIFIISVLSFFIFWGINYTQSNLAALFGVITAWVTINPLEVDVSVPAEVEIDKVFKVEARVINKGEEKIENAKGEIFLSEGLVLLKKDSVQERGVIPGKKEKKIFWQVKGEKIGNYVISVKISGELQGQEISKTASTMVQVKEKSVPGRGRSSDLFQRFFNLFRGWWF